MYRDHRKVLVEIGQTSSSLWTEQKSSSQIDWAERLNKSKHHIGSLRGSVDRWISEDRTSEESIGSRGSNVEQKSNRV